MGKSRIKLIQTYTDDSECTCELTVTYIAVKRLVDVVLLIFGAADKYNPTAIAFGAFCDAGHSSPFHWVVVFNSYRDRILSTYTRQSWLYQSEKFLMKSVQKLNNSI